MRGGAKRLDLLESDTMSDDAAIASEPSGAPTRSSGHAPRSSAGSTAAGWPTSLRDAMHRGDTVTFAFPTVTWSGVVTAVGDDVVRVAAGDAPSTSA